MAKHDDTSQQLPKRRLWLSIDKTPEQLPAVITVQDKFTTEHIIKVLRLKVGDSVLALDEQRGYGYIASIKAIQTKAAVTIQLDALVQNPSKKPFNIILAAGLIKDSHWEWLLQKATELGVSTIIPIKSQFSDIQERMVKPERWQHIVKSAALQCERFSIPAIPPLMELQALPELLPEWCMKFVLQERKVENKTLLEALQTSSQYETIVIAVGPEGGWHPEESLYLSQKQFEAVSLGDAILRAETAAIVALGSVMQINQTKET